VGCRQQHKVAGLAYGCRLFAVQCNPAGANHRHPIINAGSHWWEASFSALVLRGSGMTTAHASLSTRDTIELPPHGFLASLQETGSQACRSWLASWKLFKWLEGSRHHTMAEGESYLARMVTL
jgi:hypothetical protein